MEEKSNRRTVIKNILAGSAALAAGSSVLPSFASPHKKTEILKGNIHL